MAAESNEHGIGPDSDGGPNPHYRGPGEITVAGNGEPVGPGPGSAWDALEERRTVAREIDSQLAQEPMLRHFRYEHLNEPLAGVSSGFCEQARRVVLTMERSAERTACLRKLLEAKDCAVRAKLEEIENRKAKQAAEPGK